jgi:MoxR-like ATPase
MSQQVFISHAFKDQSIALAIASHLEEAGISVWLAPRDLAPARSFPQQLVTAIKNSRLMLLIVSTASNTSTHVVNELNVAAEVGLSILPLLTDYSDVSDSVRYYIGTAHWQDARNPPISSHYETLVRTISDLLADSKGKEEPQQPDVPNNGGTSCWFPPDKRENSSNALPDAFDGQVGPGGDPTLTRLGCAPETAMPPHLVVLATPDPGFDIGHELLVNKEVMVGREPGPNGIRVSDRALSRCHIRLRWHGRQKLLELEDLDSKNGTFVNSRTTVRRYLGHGDVIRMGDTLMTVSDWGSPPSRPISDGLDKSHDHQLQVEAQTGNAPSGAKDSIRGSLPELVASSPSMRELKLTLAQIAPGKLPVMLKGQSGTGKELAARGIHAMSGRQGAFQAINCAAVPCLAIESTFFGHAAGAFEGATTDAPGILSACDGGTLFLDEIGDLPPEAQPKLLRFVEDGLIRPVGSIEQTKADVRVVAATNSNLDQLQKKGVFRADLRARLEGIVLNIPPLKERKEDILPLIRRFAEDSGVGALAFAPDAAEALLTFRWKQNVRELKLLVSRCAQTLWPKSNVIRQPLRVTLKLLPEAITAQIRNRQSNPTPPAPASLP